ncbi:MAG: hypothetical protein ACYC4L_11485 [Chloroflexota bacterium]
MGKLGAYLAVSAWPEWNGSSIPPDCWAEYPRLINRGVSQATYILWPGNAYQDRDLERLHGDAGAIGTGFQVLVLRLGTPKGEHPGTPAAFIAKHKLKVMHAKAQGYRQILVLRFNEPNAELVIENSDGTFTVVMTPTEYDVWDAEVVRLWKVDPDLADILLIGPPIAGYNEISNHPGSSWLWWDSCIRAANARSDLGGVNLYPARLAEMGLGKRPTDSGVPGYSLPWWQGQMPGKQLWVCELGCRTGTPALTRDALLPELWRQVKACADVAGSGWFAQWAKGPEHTQHWWTSAQKDEFLAVIAEVPSTSPDPQPTQPPVAPPPATGVLATIAVQMADGSTRTYEVRQVS